VPGLSRDIIVILLRNKQRNQESNINSEQKLGHRLVSVSLLVALLRALPAEDGVPDPLRNTDVEHVAAWASQRHHRGRRLRHAQRPPEELLLRVFARRQALAEYLRDDSGRHDDQRDPRDQRRDSRRPENVARREGIQETHAGGVVVAGRREVAVVGGGGGGESGWGESGLGFNMWRPQGFIRARFVAGEALRAPRRCDKQREAGAEYQTTQAPACSCRWKLHKARYFAKTRIKPAPPSVSAAGIGRCCVQLMPDLRGAARQDLQL
jgi:hypothetical protein